MFPEPMIDKDRALRACSRVSEAGALEAGSADVSSAQSRTLCCYFPLETWAQL